MTMEGRSAPVSATRGPRSDGLWARQMTMLVAAWLCFSAFVLSHTHVSRQNSWIVGALMLVAGLGALRLPPLRFVNIALSAWLVVSSVWLFPASSMTSWHNCIVAIAVFMLSFVPSVRLRMPRVDASVHGQ